MIKESELPEHKNNDPYYAALAAKREVLCPGSIILAFCSSPKIVIEVIMYHACKLYCK